MSTFIAGGKNLIQDNCPLIMGILNYTPDSFSDGGANFTPERALEKALEMEKQGADIIDLGAASTRPGGEVVSAEDELQRLEEALGALEGKLSVPLSVDTFRAPCAELALAKGAKIINDVSGSFNREIAAMCKESGAGYIVTHNPCGADTEAQYEDSVITAIRAFFVSVMEEACREAFPLASLCLDPGIGFGKSRENDAEILGNIRWLKMSPCALLTGASRKRITASGNEPEERDFATVAAHTAAIFDGTDIIRVHNVKAAASAMKVTLEIRRYLNG